METTQLFTIAAPFDVDYDPLADLIKIDDKPTTMVIYQFGIEKMRIPYARYEMCVNEKRIVTDKEYHAIHLEVVAPVPQEKETPVSNNWKILGKGYFLVRTQAGFRQALKHAYPDAVKDRIPVIGYPLVYPSVVVIALGYRGFHYLDCYSIRVNALRDRLADA